MLPLFSDVCNLQDVGFRQLKATTGATGSKGCPLLLDCFSLDKIAIFCARSLHVSLLRFEFEVFRRDKVSISFTRIAIAVNEYLSAID
jgi:hypothetical protein